MKMNRKALIVEDDDTFLELAVSQLSQSNYYIQTAKDPETAIKLLSSELFHVALVDIELKGAPGNLFGIKEVLPAIHKNFPDCYRLLYTSRAQDRPIEVIQSLSIPKMIAHGCFLKDAEPLSKIPEFVNSLWENYIKINDNLNIITEGIELEVLLKDVFLSKKSSESEVKILTESFLSVVSRLFYGDNKMEELIIEPFKEGFSKTILFKAIAKSSLLKNRPGKQVVIKFGEKELILKESINFEKYVQWYLTQNQTIQKISFQSFNNYAAMLFTFAGDSPQNIFTFSDYIKESPEIKNFSEGNDYNVVANSCIDSMFAPSTNKREWYHPDVIERKELIGDYYLYEVLHYPPAKLNSEFFERQILSSSKSKIELKNNNTKINFLELAETISNPLYFCQRNPFTDKYSTCIIHGDLNGDNIIVNSGGDWYLLDYAHTGRGHVFQDFIYLELSVRNVIFWKNNILFTLKEIFNFEKSLINSSDFDKDKLDENDQFDNKKKFISKALKLIRKIREYAKKNFPDEDIKLYYVGLFYCTLNWLSFKIKLEQKMHILILAGLLAETLNGNPNNKK